MEMMMEMGKLPTIRFDVNNLSSWDFFIRRLCSVVSYKFPRPFAFFFLALKFLGLEIYFVIRCALYFVSCPLKTYSLPLSPPIPSRLRGEADWPAGKNRGEEENELRFYRI